MNKEEQEELIERTVNFLFTHTELWSRPSTEVGFTMEVVTNEKKHWEWRMDYQYPIWVKEAKKELLK